MKKTCLLFLLLLPALIAAQRPAMDLTFSAVNNTTWMQLDSIKIMNRTQGGDTVLYWPDTVLSFNYVGVPECPQENNTFKVFQNYPNPVADHTTVSLYVPDKDKVSITVTDILGRMIIQTERVLDRGKHSFRFTPGNGNLYFFTARWQGQSSSIKILHYGLNKGGTSSLEYIGSEDYSPLLKTMQDIQEFFFTPGDELLYIGYDDTLQSGIPDSPEESTTYTFQFATNIPCPGTPTVEYEGQVYNTIQIFSQCWLKENLNVGEMIPGTMEQSNNGTVEKYCYNNVPYFCTEYGGLYQWNEMMQYTTQQGAQGICPPGWHLPTDEEWKLLEGAVDSQYKIGYPEWDISGGMRGYDAGTNLKTTSGWSYGGNETDLFGYSGLPGGFRIINGTFLSYHHFGFWWSSTEYNGYNAWFRDLDYISPGVSRYDYVKDFGYSVRCLRDEIYIPPVIIELSFTAVNNTSYVELDSIKVMNRAQGSETTIYWPDTILVVPGDLVFTPGDELLYIGYADALQSGILDIPEQSTDYTFQFATNIPCPGTPIVEYEGQVYNTIQIFSQCWLKENLNVGEMIPGTMEQSNNGTIEKYCYNNDVNKCITHGGLYQWNEMMQYTTRQGSRGICPPGWHLPTDEEWKVLEGAVDSLYGIGDDNWDFLDYRGYDAGTNLKSTTGWFSGGNGTDIYGFTGRAGGYSTHSDGNFDHFGYYGTWNTSTEFDDSRAWGHSLRYHNPTVLRNKFNKADGFSVRCLRDEIIIPTIELTFTAVNITSYIELDSIKVMNHSQASETMIYWPDTILVVPGYLAFNPGDELLCIGYADTLQSGMLDSPEESTDYIFQFATNIPCPGTPTVEYEGQVYNTIQIFSQCWLKENLNVGDIIPGTMEQSNNGTIEKYCYNNEPDSCTKYGGLYQWWEMMQYNPEGVQGICPPGWHLPTDEEWKVLEGAADSQYGIGGSTWDSWLYRGYDAGTNLKTTSGWYGNGNGTDLFGFSGLPGGVRVDNGSFGGVGYFGYWWTSTAGIYGGNAWLRLLDFYSPEVFRYYDSAEGGFSVRCLRDEVYLPPVIIELTFTALNNTSYIELDSIKVMNRTQGVETTIYWQDTSLVVPGDLVFTPGDELLFIGYADTLQSGILDVPWESTDYIFQFATNIPCPGTPTVEYEGQVYNTIQIFSQCWLKENLNVGTMIPGSQSQSNNGTIEKYCYNNEPDSCAKYGGLYQWNEMMQYTTQQGARGICPPGWHLPTDEEWKVLEGAVDSQFGIGDNNWDYSGYRGYDAGTNLKTTSGWYGNGNGTDLFGFSGLPGGYLYDDGYGGGYFDDVGHEGIWRTSTEGYYYAWFRVLNYNFPEVGRNDGLLKEFGFSVRCLRDN